MGAVRRATALLAGVVLLSVTLGAQATVAAGAPAVFGPPSATAQWGVGITFRETVTLAEAPSRIELVTQSGVDPRGSFVASVAGTAAGERALVYTVDGSQGGMLPNTKVTARWRITYPDGRTDLGPPVSAVYADTRFQWQTLTGSIVRVHWYTGGDAFGRRALSIAERAIERISTSLGVTDRRPVDFFIYSGQSAFYDALGPGTRENVGGQANPELRTLFALITPGEIDAAWVSTVIPHELLHLVFDTAVGNPYRYPPSWLNEGLATYTAQGYDESNRAWVEAAVADRTVMPLEALSGRFPTTYERFALAYAESTSAIDFLVRRYGRSALSALVRAYATGVSDDAALKAALGVDLAGFQAAWLKDLGAAAPKRYGPVPAPPGPTPAAWTGSGGSGELGSGAPAVSPDASDEPSELGDDAPDAPSGELGELAILSIAAIVALAAFGLRRRRHRSPPPGAGPMGDGG